MMLADEPDWMATASRLADNHFADGDVGTANRILRAAEARGKRELLRWFEQTRELLGNPPWIQEAGLLIRDHEIAGDWATVERIVDAVILRGGSSGRTDR